ncbi:ribosomal protein S5 domain 2-type protein [Jimgerdemannia flammicorona]|uniref:Ribosomal RNA-processing protein 41 n=1 Tax=Jimgerdemannia flammicorona TaxID=994334 RepID=A0A433Q5V6_9FUNG|nr:ribosomal protein S5 domain 2-type protein [Jimgerdemannia flammicorona]
MSRIFTINMSRLELLSPEGLRIDGRRANELRKLTAKTGVLSQADGSAYIEQGNTKCLAAVYGPREVRHKMNMLHDRAIINVEFNMAPFSTAERKKRSKNDKQVSKSVLGIITFEPVIKTTLYPRSQIDIYLQILQHDGGDLQACINAATLALIDAGLPMIDYVCACTAGSIDKEPIVDLNHVEESSDSPELTVAILPKTGKVNLLQMESRLHVDNFESVANLASEGCENIYQILDQVIRDRTKGLLKQMKQ